MQWTEFRSHIGYLDESDLERTRAAFDLCKRVHERQKRKSGDPYYTHPVAVAMILADYEADADTIIAALLHDAVEDTPLTLEGIEREFGPSVAALIDGATKIYPEDVAWSPALDDQIETLRKIFTLMEKDVRIMIIKIADRLHNMQTIAFMPEERKRSYAQETLDVFVKIAERLCIEHIKDELEALCLAVLESDLFPKLQELRKKHEKESETMIEDMRRALSPQLSVLGASLHYEHRSWEKLRRQLETEGAAVTGLATYTVVFVCPSRETCYSVLGALHGHWRREVLSFEDFINSPMGNGYRGLHTTVILEDGTRIRCKIRTEDMQEYARRGITMTCFDRKALGIMEYLPWATKIGTLSADTALKSAEFWESLQSDILGDCIVIHGPADQAIVLPKGSTALDGAFYCFQDAALKLKGITVDGEDVPFSVPLRNAQSLEVQLQREKTVNRTWIDWVNTGYAVAKIRKELAKESEGKRVAIGTQLLQEVMTERRRGFIEEFDASSFDAAAKALGYRSIRQAYISIADGHLSPDDLCRAIFEPKEMRRTQKEKEACMLRFAVDVGDIDLIIRVIHIEQKHGIDLRNLSFRPFAMMRGNVRLRCELSREEQRAIVQELKDAGAEDIGLTLARSMHESNLGILLLIILWGLDPVVAYFLLRATVTAAELTVLRIVVFFLVSSVLLCGQQIFSHHKLKPLSPLQPSLILSGMLLFFTALSSYMTLTLIPPVQYILLITGGLALTVFMKSVTKKTISPALLLTATTIVATLIILTKIQGTSTSGLLWGSASSFGFAMYSVVSRRYQQHIGLVYARYPAFLFWLSFFGLPFAVFLLPFSNLSQLPLENILLAAGFVCAFNVLPYALYYELAKRVDANTLDRLLLFVIAATIAGEALTTLSPHPLIALLAVMALLWQLRKGRGQPAPRDVSDARGPQLASETRGSHGSHHRTSGAGSGQESDGPETTIRTLS